MDRVFERPFSKLCHNPERRHPEGTNRAVPATAQRMGDRPALDQPEGRTRRNLGRSSPRVNDETMMANRKQQTDERRDARDFFRESGPARQPRRLVL